MKNLISALNLLIISQLLISCFGPRNLNERKILIVPKEDICIEPPAEYYQTELSSHIDLKIPYIKENLDAGLSINSKAEKIREALPETFNFETIEYRLCIAVTQGRLSQKEYKELIEQILPKLNKTPEFIKLNITVISNEGMTKEPLIGASVTIAGTTVGTITDVDGKGVILVPKNMSDDITIVVSRTGYSSYSKVISRVRYNQEIKIVVPYY